MDIDVILADQPGLGRVRLCECNSIHLNIGPVTINLAADAFAQTAILLQDAMEQLNEIFSAMSPERNPLRAGQPGKSRMPH